MATIQFKAKVQLLGESDSIRVRQFVPVPEFTRKHCDMAAFRNHPKFGMYANSDLFPSVLARIRADMLAEGVKDFRTGKPAGIMLDKIPANVTVDAAGFLATVTVTV
jgi:hypothetical protein